MPGLPGGGLGPAPFGHMSGMMWGWGGPDGRGGGGHGGGHGGGNGGGAKRRRSAAGGGQGGPSGASKGEFYSSSYVNFSKVPVSHKLEILAALEPVKLNPVYMGDAQMAEACRLVKAIQDAPQHVFAYSLSLVFLQVDALLWVATGKLPNNKLDFSHRPTQLAAFQMEYRRRGEPLKNHSRETILQAVQEQHPQVWAWIMSSASVMAWEPGPGGLGGLSGSGGFGVHGPGAPLGLAAGAGQHGIMQGAGPGPLSLAGNFTIETAAGGRQLLSDGAAAVWLPAGRQWSILLDPSRLCMVSDGTCSVYARQVVANPQMLDNWAGAPTPTGPLGGLGGMSLPAAANSVLSLPPLPAAGPTVQGGAPGAAAPAAAHVTPGSLPAVVAAVPEVPQADGAPKVETDAVVKATKNGQMYVMDQSTLRTKWLHRRASGGADDWTIMTHGGKQFLVSLSGQAATCPVESFLAGAPPLVPTAQQAASGSDLVRPETLEPDQERSPTETHSPRLASEGGEE